LALYLVGTSGTAKLTLVSTSSAILGTATNAWTVGTAFQANATYNATTGAFAFRQGRAANGSGTGATGAGGVNPTTFIGADINVSSQLLNAASIAELIIYNRVLTSTEITNVENYLNAKWGV